jgi:MFS family permease
MNTVETPDGPPVVAARATDTTAERDQHLRRNFLLTLGEIIAFGIGAAFFDSGTVLIAFVATLTASTALLGLVPTISQMGMGLPQLVAARFLARRPRKVPFLIAASLFRNIPVFVLAAAAWTRPAPTVMLAVFFVCYALFSLGVGLESVAWIDIFATITPAARRGQVSAIGRTAGNICSLAAGFVVARILTTEGQFPRNYALLFLAAAVMLTIAFATFAFVHEPTVAHEASADPRGAPDDRSILAQGRRIWREDGEFRRLVWARILYIAHFVAIPFYLKFARDVVGVGDGAVGTYVSASMFGQLLAAGLWGWLSARVGNRVVVQCSLLLAALLPLYVLLTPQLPPAAFILVYVASGAVLTGEFIGWMNLLLGIAPAAQRPLYISLQGTLLLPANLLPLFGAVALSVIPYGLFFPIIALALAASLLLVSRIGRGVSAGV